MWRLQPTCLLPLLAPILASCGARSDLAGVEAEREGELDLRDARIFIADAGFPDEDRGRILAYETFEGRDYAEVDVGPVRAVCSPHFDFAGRLVFLDRDLETARIARVDLETGVSERSATFSSPVGLDDVAPDAHGGFWTTDYQGSRVGYFASIDATPVYLGSEGYDVGQFQHPVGVAVTPAGKILVADGSNRRVVQIDDVSGAGWQELYVDGILGGALTGITIDAKGRMVVADGDGRLHRYDDMLRNGHVFYEADTPDTVGETFFGVGVGPDDRLYASFADPQGVAIWRMDDFDGAGLTVLDKPLAGMPTYTCGGIAVR